jgi:hypothetical protein
MSWTCPHQTKDGFCELRKEKCNPGSKGCVLENKVKIIGPESDDELNKKRGKRNNNNNNRE